MYWSVAEMTIQKLEQILYKRVNFTSYSEWTWKVGSIERNLLQNAKVPESLKRLLQI